MSFIGTVCGRIQKRRIKNGYSFNLMLIHNYRDFGTGKPRFDVVVNFQSIRSYNLKRDAPTMWRRINRVLDYLSYKNEISKVDAERAKGKFKEVLGEPAPAIPAPPIPKSNPTDEEKIRARLERLTASAKT